MKRSESTQPATDQGLTGWWRRLFSTKTGPQLASAAARAASIQPARAGQASHGAHNHNAAYDPEWVRQCPGFAAHAHALALPFAPLVPLTAAQQAQADELVAALLAEAAAVDTGPTALPTASLRVLQLVAKEELELSELTSAIQQDPALSAAVLRLANSAALGGAAGSINTVRDAVTRVGVRDSGRAVGIVAAQALFSPESKLAQRLFGPRLSELHIASAAAASGAAQLSMERNVGRSDLAFLAGMLHDVGKSLALSALTQLFHDERVPAEIPNVVLDVVLERVHVDIGSQALRRWELPPYLIDMCAQHHAAKCPLNADTRELHLVRVASGLIALRLKPQTLDHLAQVVDSLDALQVTPLQTRAVDTALRVRTAQVRQLLAKS
ncbi:MAG: hypothetical protein RL701_475 [Pseudomonadota bacterium]